MEKQRPDYGHPAVFFGILGFLSFASYHLSQLIDMNSIILFIIWFVLTSYVFMSIRKKGLATNHPALFFALIITFSITSYYVESVLNIEMYIMLLVWLMLTGFTLRWMTQNPRADKRLFYLLSAQFFVIALLIPLFVQLTQGICVEHMSHGHAATHDDVFSERLLVTFEYVMVFTSIFVALRAMKKARYTTIYPSESV